MRCALYGLSRSAAMLALLVFGVAGRAGAGPLNPLAFTSLGAFPSAPGTYTINTTGPNPTLAEPDGTTLTGIVSNGIAVFDFNAITVGSGQTFVGSGSMPLALLSRSDITVNGTIDVSASLPKSRWPRRLRWWWWHLRPRHWRFRPRRWRRGRDHLHPLPAAPLRPTND